MFNTLFLNLVEFEEKLFRSFKSSDFYFLFVFKFENLGAKCFWNLLGLFMCISCHKNCLSVVFLQNFQSFSKFQKFSLVRSIEVDPWPIENVQFVGQNSLPGLIASQSLFNRSKFFNLPFRSLLDSSRPIEIRKFRILKSLSD